MSIKTIKINLKTRYFHINSLYFCNSLPDTHLNYSNYIAAKNIGNEIIVHFCSEPLLESNIEEVFESDLKLFFQVAFNKKVGEGYIVKSIVTFREFLLIDS